MNPFSRKPVIYDLWADIRIQWRLADYFESKWQLIGELKDGFMTNGFMTNGFMTIGWDSLKNEPVYKMYPYQLHLRGE
jgi:hypothetical protein